MAIEAMKTCFEGFLESILYIMIYIDMFLRKCSEK